MNQLPVLRNITNASSLFSSQFTAVDFMASGMAFFQGLANNNAFRNQMRSNAPVAAILNASEESTSAIIEEIQDTSTSVIGNSEGSESDVENVIQNSIDVRQFDLQIR